MSFTRCPSIFAPTVLPTPKRPATPLAPLAAERFAVPSHPSLSAAAPQRRVSACSSRHSHGRNSGPCGERLSWPPSPDRRLAVPTVAAGSDRGEVLTVAQRAAMVTGFASVIGAIDAARPATSEIGGHGPDSDGEDGGARTASSSRGPTAAIVEEEVERGRGVAATGWMAWLSDRR